MNGLCCFHQGASLNIQIHQKSHVFSVPIELFTSSTLIPSRFTCCLHNKIRLKPTAFQNASSLVHVIFLGYVHYFQNRYRRMSRALTQFHVKRECLHSFNSSALPKTLSGRQMANIVNRAQPSINQLKTKKWPNFFRSCSFSIRQFVFWFSLCLCLGRLVLLLWPFYWSRWCWWFFLYLVLKETTEGFTINK